MIPVVVIILLIILLIYKLRTPPEEYKIEGLSLSWVNKANIEGTVTKWVFVIKDKDGVEIHRATDNESKNLKDFSAVTVDIIDNKEFDEKIIGDNTLELYYNEVNAENLLYTKIIQFSKDDFTSVIDMDGLEEIAEPPPPPTDVCINDCRVELISPNGVYKAVTQGDGNFVVYKSGQAIWASGTSGKGTGPYKTIMQTDGNLVLYDSNGVATWDSGSNNKGSMPFKAIMQNDGNLVVYSSTGATWSSQGG